MSVERNRKAGQNPPRVVAPVEEEEKDKYQKHATQVYVNYTIYPVNSLRVSANHLAIFWHLKCEG
jgi:hypothetical protein